MAASHGDYFLLRGLAVIRLLPRWYSIRTLDVTIWRVQAPWFQTRSAYHCRARSLPVRSVRSVRLVCSYTLLMLCILSMLCMHYMLSRSSGRTRLHLLLPERDIGKMPVIPALLLSCLLLPTSLLHAKLRVVANMPATRNCWIAVHQHPDLAPLRFDYGRSHRLSPFGPLGRCGFSFFT